MSLWYDARLLFSPLYDAIFQLLITDQFGLVDTQNLHHMIHLGIVYSIQCRTMAKMILEHYDDRGVGGKLISIPRIRRNEGEETEKKTEPVLYGSRQSIEFKESLPAMKSLRV